jgi:hypothetical protein
MLLGLVSGFLGFSLGFGSNADFIGIGESIGGRDEDLFEGLD